MADTIEALRIGIYSIWRRDDGKLREVLAVEFWHKGRRSGEAVHTRDPMPSNRRYDRADSGYRRLTVDRFLATHVRVSAEEAATATRLAAVQPPLF